ncbi:hypothetical protein F5Y07DRAFT_363954 [Xylaria sp. FL0933]|nr:hypothetical protein F5Y07DRAFT_363954 [Xylaria sp. FL0933]
MATSHSPTRRNSGATDLTLTESYTDFAYDMKSHAERGKYLDDDEKTITDLAQGESSSTHSKKKLSTTMKQLKSKLKSKEEKPKKKKSPLPPDYYPSTLQTFEALAASRM